jgi:hypothetical protein
MRTLAELQREFLATLFAAEGTTSPALAAEIRGGAFTPAERLAIHRNNLRANFRKVLALEFPVLEQLVGAAYFDQLALEFLAAHPSRSGDLHRIGAPLPDFLRTTFADGEYAYFADVAALEWAWQDSMVAPDADSTLDLDALAAVAPEVLPELRLHLQPALRLVASPWPVFTIWDAHRRAALQGEEPGGVALDGGAERIVVRRVGGLPEARLCGAGDFAWLQSLAGGAPLGTALDCAAEADDRFDVAATLRWAVSLDLVAGFSLRP